MKKKVLVAIPWHAGGINAILPIISALIDKSDIELITIADRRAKDYLKGKDVGYIPIDFYDEEYFSLMAMVKLLREKSPDLVITSTGGPQKEGYRDLINQKVVLAARELRIGSLVVLDAWTEYIEKFSDIFTNELFKFLPDKIAVMDSFAKEEMIKKGFPKSKLIVTGNPFFEDLREKKLADREPELMGIVKDCNLLISYITNCAEKYKEILGYWDLDNIAIIGDIFNSLHKKYRESFCLIVALHPNTPEKEHQKIKNYVDGISGRAEVVKGIDVQDLVLASDLVLNAWSTVAIEAVLMKKPCISMQPGLKTEDQLVVSKRGIIPVGYTKGECEKIVKKAITDKYYREIGVVRNYSKFKVGNRAKQKIIELISEMLK